MNRRTILALVAAVAVGSAGVGWFAGQQIKSPADVAAEAEPPPASLITVPVEERELSTNVIIRGQVEFDDVAEIPVNPSAEGSTIITSMTKVAGDDLAEGDVAVEVAGRPLFVLEGELPIFRPLAPGVEGPDVRQLETALSRLGFDPGPIDETYDNETEAAVSEMYRAAGYSPNEATSAELEQLQSARDRVRSAQQNLQSAREGLGGQSVSESTRLQLDQSVREAENFLADAKAERDAVLAEVGVRQEQAWAATEVAATALSTAESRLAEANAGTHPDTGEPPTPEELDVLIDAVEAAQAEVAAATAEEGAIKAEMERLQVEQDRIVEAADVGLRIQIASRAETLAPPDNSGVQESIAAAQREVADANEALATLDASIGTSIPANEILFLPELPRQIQRVNVKTGDVPQGSAMSVTGSGVAIRSSVSAADRPLLTEGVEALMEDAGLGVSLPVTVAFVADSPGGPNAGDGRYAVRLEPVGDVPEDAINQNLRVTVPFQSTNGAVLAVPIAALSAGADGNSRVQVERSEGVVETVSVKTGLLARSVGLVEISPIDGDLAAGDRVVVGRDTSSGPDEANEGDDETDDESNESDE